MGRVFLLALGDVLELGLTKDDDNGEGRVEGMGGGGNTSTDNSQFVRTHRSMEFASASRSEQVYNEQVRCICLKLGHNGRKKYERKCSSSPSSGHTDFSTSGEHSTPFSDTCSTQVSTSATSPSADVSEIGRHMRRAKKYWRKG